MYISDSKFKILVGIIIAAAVLISALSTAVYFTHRKPNILIDRVEVQQTESQRAQADADKAASAAETAAVSARRAADSTKETANKADKAAVDASDAARDAQKSANQIN